MPHLSDCRPSRHPAPSKNEKQQPCVPIQFVWHNGYVNHVSGFQDVSDDLFGNCEVEQIGAVLYVRSSDE